MGINKRKATRDPSSKRWAKRWGPFVQKMVSDHARKEKMQICQPWLEFDRFETSGLLTPVESEESVKVLQARRKKLFKGLKNAEAHLDEVKRKYGRAAIPLGNASARCREWQAAIRDCNAVLAKRGDEDANEDDEDADEEDDGVTAPAPPEHDFLMGC